MAATRETVLAAIVEYVQKNGRRAPAKEIAAIVGDKLPVVQGIIKELVAAGSVESSRGRNGGALPPGVTLQKTDKPAKVAKAVADANPQPADGQNDDALADQFAALMDQLGDDAHPF